MNKLLQRKFVIDKKIVKLILCETSYRQDISKKNLLLTSYSKENLLST